MALLKVENVAIRGISACVPPDVEENMQIDLYTPEEAAQIVKSTGIERRHIAAEGVTSSDLCGKAAEKLIASLGWDKDSIDAIGYFTQTPDFLNHPSVFEVHKYLGMSEDCACYDFYHGCPGWVLSLSAMGRMMGGETGHYKRVLLIGGDAVSRREYRSYREERPLFGDCGTATALEFDEKAAKVYFDIGTRSSDGESLIRPNGGERHPYTIESLQHELDLREGKISPDETGEAMDGMSVFSFGISVPPKSIKRLSEFSGVSLEDVDEFVFHQANLFMLNKIAKKLKIDNSKMPTSLKEYGNTTSASIPLTIVSQCGSLYRDTKVKTMACAFGTGLSWGSIYFETEKIIIPEVITYDKL